MKHLPALIFAFGFATTPAVAADLNQTLDRLVKELEGSWDSGPQLTAEKLSGTPDDHQHVRVNRTFTRIDAPDVSEYVFAVTLRDGGPDGPIDMAEFQVWTLEIEASRNAVKMAPWRYKTPEAYVGISTNADAMAGLTQADLTPSEGAAGCIIYWRPVGDLVHGVAGQPCEGAVRPGRPVLSWEWTYILGDTALWMSFAGRLPSGEISFGRQDQTPWRLDKMN